MNVLFDFSVTIELGTYSIDLHSVSDIYKHINY